MAVALTTPVSGRRALTDLRSWWRIVRPPPTVLQRLDRLYVIAITGGILGALAYGTASSALAAWITPATIDAWGPSLALVAVLLGLRWGSVQGPVVYSVADVGFVLGAPLPRRALAWPRLLRGFAIGAGGGVLVAAIALIGLGGDGRGVPAGEVAEVTIGAALCGALAMAGASAVQGSARWDRATRLAMWPVLLIAAGLVVVASHDDAGRAVALWSGPWGWIVQPVAGVRHTAPVAALAATGVLTLAACAIAVWRCGNAPTERHARRAEARAGAVASLWSFDARTARQGLRGVGATASRRPTRTLPLPRSPDLAIAWRDAVVALSSPRQLVEGVALSAGGALLWLLSAGKPAAGAAGALVVYLGVGRLLEPLRAEVDVPNRARVLLRRPLGRVLLDHAFVPAVVGVLAVSLAIVGCSVAGALPDDGAAIALLTLAAVPTVTLCAGLSGRRGGRLPMSMLSSASAGDPSGGGIVVLWLVGWPLTAAVLGGGPAILVAHVGSSVLPAAIAVAALAPAALGAALGRPFSDD
jgi:hypothetical protein